jgi:hypothetical protein
MKQCLLLLLVLLTGCKGRPAQNVSVVAATTPLRWVVNDSGTEVIHNPYPTADGLLSVDGFWVPTSTAGAKQLPLPLAVKIECDRSERVCREFGAQVSFGVLVPSESVYSISSWTASGIEADDNYATCSTRHRMTVDFQSKTVSVVDYPTAATATNSNPICDAFKDSSSYVLHDGAIILNGSVPFDQSAIRR